MSERAGELDIARAGLEVRSVGSPDLLEVGVQWTS
jgi:hypothetical protein